METDTNSQDHSHHHHTPQNSCLICYSTCNDSNILNPDANESEQLSLPWRFYTEQNAIFLLRILLEIPQNSLEDFNLGVCLKPPLITDWIKTCEQCSKAIDRAKEVYDEILDTTEKFRRVQKEIVDILKKKTAADSADNHRVRSELPDEEGCRVEKTTTTDCVKKCRKFVNDHGFGDFKYPFVVQHLESLVPGQSATEQNNLEDDNSKCHSIKVEIPDDLEDHDGNISLLRSPQGLLEQIMLILPEEDVDEEEDDDEQPEFSSKDLSPSTKEVVKEEIESEEEQQDVGPDEIDTPKSLENENDKQCADEETSRVQNLPQTLKDEATKKPKRRRRKRTGPLSSFKDLHECKQCEKSFKSLETLKTHQNRFHRGLKSGKKKFSCPVKGCSLVYSHKGPLDVHVSQHRNKPTRKCGVCGMAFYHPEQLRRHKRQNHDPAYQKQQEEKLKKKMKKKASSSKSAADKQTNPQNSTEFECPVCHKFLKSLDTLRYHVKKLHPDSNVPIIKRPPPPDAGDKPLFQKQPYNLSRFDKLYPEMSAKITRNSDGKFPCPEPNCGGIFPRKDKLERHICTQHLGGDLLFRCTWEDCDKSFLKRESYQDHLDKHTGTPRLKCDVCGIQFYSRNPLTRHQEKEHQDGKNRKPFVCEICGKAYACRDFLSTHKYIAHRKGEKKQQQQVPKREGAVVVQSEDTSIICDLCGKLLKNKQNLKAHIKTVHEKLPRKHECHLCPKKFHISTHLKHHLYKTHKIKVENYKPKEERMKRFQCPVVGCRLPFFNKELFQKHMSLKHGDDGQKAPQYKCRYCGKEYHLKFKLKHHEEVHANQETKPWKCSICEKGFLTSAHLKFHLKHTHKMRLEEVRKIVGAASNIKQEEAGEGEESMLQKF